jgi:hypothetical protein
MYYDKLIVLLLFCGVVLSCNNDKKNNTSLNTTTTANKAVLPSVPVPMDLCIEAHLQEIGSMEETEKFCNCYVPKFASLLENDSFLLDAASKGQMDKLPVDKKVQLLRFYQDCFSHEEIVNQLEAEGFSPEVVEGLKRGLKGALANTNAAQLFEVDAFCDCVVAGIQERYTIMQVMNGEIMEMESYKALQDSCGFVNRKSQ